MQNYNIQLKTPNFYAYLLGFLSVIRLTKNISIINILIIGELFVFLQVEMKNRIINLIEKTYTNYGKDL